MVLHAYSLSKNVCVTQMQQRIDPGPQRLFLRLGGKMTLQCEKEMRAWDVAQL